MKIGVMYGDPRVSTGGRAIRYGTAIRLRMNKAKKEMVKIEDAEFEAFTMNPYGYKNKTAQPGRKLPVTLITGVREPFIDVVAEITALGKAMGVFLREDGRPIKGSCKWFFGEEALGTGETQVQTMLRENSTLRQAAYDAIQAKIVEMNSFGYGKED